MCRGQTRTGCPNPPWDYFSSSSTSLGSGWGIPPLLPRQFKGFQGSSGPWKRRIVVFPASWEVMVLLAAFAILRM